MGRVSPLALAFIVAALALAAPATAQQDYDASLTLAFGPPTVQVPVNGTHPVALNITYTLSGTPCEVVGDPDQTIRVVLTPSDAALTLDQTEWSFDPACGVHQTTLLARVAGDPAPGARAIDVLGHADRSCNFELAVFPAGCAPETDATAALNLVTVEAVVGDGGVGGAGIDVPDRGSSGGGSGTMTYILAGGSVGALVVVGLAAIVAARVRKDRAEDAAALAPAVAPAAPAAGALFLGKYQVLRELGRGAFGVVWLAEHTKLDRKVVIKQLHPGLAADPEARKRFEREARILAKLDHPHVTRIHDVELVGNAWFLVIEHVAGGTLETLTDAGPCDVATAARITRDVLEGLAYIHDAGVLHRDVKPSNILLTAKGSAKLADFGIAWSAGPSVTVSGVPGSPLYMAPERFRGEAGDERSDLYAVAAVFYALVTGRAPVGGATPRDFLEVARAVESGGPELPVPGLSKALNDWLGKGLAKEPDERFQSAAEMAEALAVALAAETWETP